MEKWSCFVGGQHNGETCNLNLNNAMTFNTKSRMLLHSRDRQELNVNTVFKLSSSSFN